MKSKAIWILILIVIAAGAFYFLKPKTDKNNVTIQEINPKYGVIEKKISTTAIIQPQNRLEMKPPVAGRIDSILVKEGDEVKSGTVVAMMSSTERAAILDAARAKGDAELATWEDVYRPIPLIAPIDGTVIVSTMQPGQTVAQADPVIVLSNRLIVQAQVDETDIGRVAEGQDAEISLDAYPEIRIHAVVDHIYHESKVMNNVAIYNVDLIPDEVPAVFRSGMSATAVIIEQRKEHALLVPIDAVQRGQRGSFVLVSQGKGQKPERAEVETGLTDDENIEILSGINEDDTLIIESKKYTPAKAAGGSNPFDPRGQRRNRTSGGSSQGGNAAR